MKKLLILAGAGPHAKVVEAAKEMGIYTIVADYIKDFRYSPAKEIADCAVDCNIYDVDFLTEYCRENEVSGVIDFCIDPAQKPAYEIAHNLGLPVFGNEKQVDMLTQKPLFKEMCKKNGVDIIEEYTEEQLKNNEVKFPVLLKPTDSRGSRGVVVCGSLEEYEKIASSVKAESSDGGIVIERYMQGHTDLTISYLVKDGEPTLVSLGDRYPGKISDGLDRQLSCTVQPSKHIAMYMEKVDERVKNLIKDIGIKNGPVFVQGFEDGDTVRLYDPGLRYPGNEYERIYAAATGFDLVKSIISYSVGGEIDDFGGKVKGSYDLNGKLAIQYMINIRAGKVASFDGLDEIAALPAVIDIQQRHFPGDTLEFTGDIRHRAGEISVLVSRNAEEITKVLSFIQDKLSIKDENGENMIVSTIDKDMVGNVYGG